MLGMVGDQRLFHCRVVCDSDLHTHDQRCVKRRPLALIRTQRGAHPENLQMPSCRLPPLRATVPTLLACCVGCILFQSRLALVQEEFSRMHEEGLFSRRVRLAEPESLICPADGAVSAAPSELLSTEARKVRLRLLREQARPEDPSLRQLLDSAAQAPRSSPSVTVVLEFRSAAALCRQLEGLLHQTVKAHAIWVSDFQSADGGAEASHLVVSPNPNRNPQPSTLNPNPHPSPFTPQPQPSSVALTPHPHQARRLVERFNSDTISVISSSGAPGGDGRGSGTHGQAGRLVRFQMALQAIHVHTHTYMHICMYMCV